MPKSDFQKHTLFLRAGDYQYLSEQFPRTKAAVIIRRIVSKFVDKVDSQSTVSEQDLTDLVNTED